VRRGRVDPAAILKWQDEEKSKQWTLHPSIDEVRIDLPLNLSQQVVSGDFFLRAKDDEKTLVENPLRSPSS
jgi:hypothetical protein